MGVWIDHLPYEQAKKSRTTKVGRRLAWDLETCVKTCTTDHPLTDTYYTALWYLIILNPFGERNIHWITSHLDPFGCNGIAIKLTNRRIISCEYCDFVVHPLKIASSNGSSFGYKLSSDGTCWCLRPSPRMFPRRCWRWWKMQGNMGFAENHRSKVR